MRQSLRLALLVAAFFSNISIAQEILSFGSLTKIDLTSVNSENSELSKAEKNYCSQSIFDNLKAGTTYIFSNDLKNETGAKLFINQVVTKSVNKYSNQELNFIESDIVSKSHIFEPMETGRVLVSVPCSIDKMGSSLVGKDLIIVHKTFYSLFENGQWSRGRVHSTCVT